MGKKTYFLDRFFKRQSAPVEDAAPPPEKGVARFFFLLTTHLSKLFILNMLFLVFCLPVITIPAAVAGMSRVCMLLVRNGVSFVWTDFITEVKASFLKSIPVFISCAAFIGLAYFCFISSRNSGELSFFLISISVFLFIMGLLIGCYAFAMLSMCSLRIRDILKNAFLLFFLEPKADLALVLFVGVIAAAFIWLLPYTIPLALIFFALLSLISSIIVNEPLKRRIIKEQ